MGEEGATEVEYVTLCYDRPDGQGPEKIWFPDGSVDVQVQYRLRDEHKFDFQAKDEEYTDSAKEGYKCLFEEGKWQNGKIPLVPPVREWISYDF